MWNDSSHIACLQLDELPLSDADKQQLGSGIQKVAMGGINYFVWGTLALAFVGLILFNFFR